jgi:hypothetical protein
MFQNVVQITKCWLWFVYSTPIIIKFGLPLTYDNSSYLWKLLLVAVLCCMFVCKPYSSIIPSRTQNIDVAFSFHNILVMSFAGYHCWRTYHRYNNQWHVGTKTLQSTTVLLVCIVFRKKANCVVDIMMSTHYSELLSYWDGYLNSSIWFVKHVSIVGTEKDKVIK